MSKPVAQLPEASAVDTAAARGVKAGGTSALGDSVFDPHEGLRPLLDAAERTRARVAVLPVAMLWRPRPYLTDSVEVFAKAIAFVVPHFRLVGQIWQRRGYDLIVVREFLTTLVLMVWPLIWPLRRQVYFLVNHNLQEAHRRRLERYILRLLHRTGFRFACFETLAGFVDIGIVPDEERFLVLPHPIGAQARVRPERSQEGLPVVGVIGTMRAEKGSEELLAALERLRADGRLDVRLLLGCPAEETRTVWAARGFDTLGTWPRADYLASLDQCDVVVFNYQRHRYFYRPSGVAADALSRGAAVVCPDYPIMRHQLTVPARVGALFGSLDELPAAIGEALALRPTLAAALADHRRTRDSAALAHLLDRFVERVLGKSRD